MNTFYDATWTPVEVGCHDCGATCPLTNDTDPPLTREAGDAWYAEHLKECPGYRWPKEALS